MTKHYDYGRKYNPVTATIEVTKNDNDILDDSKVVENLEKHMGKVSWTSASLSAQEEERFHKAQQIVQDAVEEINKRENTTG